MTHHVRINLIIIGKIRTATTQRQAGNTQHDGCTDKHENIRKAIEAEEPTTVLINVVSAVSRDSTATFCYSKKDGLSFVICE